MNYCQLCGRKMSEEIAARFDDPYDTCPLCEKEVQEWQEDMHSRDDSLTMEQYRDKVKKMTDLQFRIEYGQIYESGKACVTTEDGKEWQESMTILDEEKARRELDSFSSNIQRSMQEGAE